MTEDTGWVAVVTLPEHISGADADRVRERLLWVINRGAAVLVADLTATVYCDNSGVHALLRAYQRGMVSGTQLRLVVTADAVRRALILNGLARLAPMYLTPSAALADSHESSPQPTRGLRRATLTLVPPRGGQPARTPAAGSGGQLLDSAVSSIFRWPNAGRTTRDLIRELAHGTGQAWRS
jgi:anti-sigma B factor antagonist